MQILKVNLETLSRSVLASYGLGGRATVRLDNGSELEFILSHSTIETIKECVQRDYEQVIGKLK